jgi:hypothetical protein
MVNDLWDIYKNRNVQNEIWDIYLLPHTFVLQYCLYNLILQLISKIFCVIKYKIVRVFMILC